MFDVVPDAIDTREVLMTFIMNASRFAEGNKAAIKTKLAAFQRLTYSFEIDLENVGNENIKDRVGNNCTLYFNCFFTVDVVICCFCISCIQI